MHTIAHTFAPLISEMDEEEAIAICSTQGAIKNCTAKFNLARALHSHFNREVDIAILFADGSVLALDVDRKTRQVGHARAYDAGWMQDFVEADELFQSAVETWLNTSPIRGGLNALHVLGPNNDNHRQTGRSRC